MGEGRSGGSRRGQGQAGRRGQPEREHDEFQAGTDYQPSTNQARDEPLPASHHDDGRQEESRRRGEPQRGQSQPAGDQDRDRGQ